MTCCVWSCHVRNRKRYKNSLWKHIIQYLYSELVKKNPHEYHEGNLLHAHAVAFYCLLKLNCPKNK